MTLDAYQVKIEEIAKDDVMGQMERVTALSVIIEELEAIASRTVGVIKIRAADLLSSARALLPEDGEVS